MSYAAKVFNVMIASPNDVAQERGLIRELIYEWNEVNSFIRKTVLQPIGWETHATPEMGKHPQKLINEQLLCKCDLLVGVFWTRLGTPTDEYISGSVEEIEEHIKMGKPTMLYFSNVPVRIDSVNQEQYQQLQEFKESLMSRGLYAAYDSVADFGNLFSKQLQRKINEHEYFKFEKMEGDANSDKTENDNQVLLIQSRNSAIDSLSDEEKNLLKEASKDVRGTILRLRDLGGTTIQTNGNILMRTHERRTIAAWEEALQSLERMAYITQTDYEGKVYQLTATGYSIADKLL